MKKNTNDDQFGDFFSDFQKRVQMQQAQQDAFFKNAGFGGFGDFGGTGNSRRVETSQDANGNIVRKVFVNGNEVTGDDAGTQGDQMMQMFGSSKNRGMFNMKDFDEDDQLVNPNKIIIDRMGCSTSNTKKPAQKKIDVPQPVTQKGGQGGQGSAQSGDSNRKAAEIVMELLNKYRKSKGLGLVAQDEEIYGQCLTHSKRMAGSGSLTHNGFQERVDALSYQTGASAENVAMFGMSISDPAQIADQFMDQWKHSPGHNANMLNRVCDRASVAVAKNGGSYYATMILVQKG